MGGPHCRYWVGAGDCQARPGALLPTRVARLSGVKQVLQSSTASVTLWGRGCQAGPPAKPPEAPPSCGPRHSLEVEDALALGLNSFPVAVAHKARGPGARRQRAERRRERRRLYWNHSTCVKNRARQRGRGRGPRAPAPAGGSRNPGRGLNRRGRGLGGAWPGRGGAGGAGRVELREPEWGLRRWGQGFWDGV